MSLRVTLMAPIAFAVDALAQAQTATNFQAAQPCLANFEAAPSHIVLTNSTIFRQFLQPKTPASEDDSAC